VAALQHAQRQRHDACVRGEALAGGERHLDTGTPRPLVPFGCDPRDSAHALAQPDVFEALGELLD
jgi:hypothetical protein